MSTELGRGDIVVLNFDPQAGHEQKGRRTGIILSPKEFNKETGFVAICPITNQKKGYPFEVSLTDEGIQLNEGFPITGVILTDQVRTLDWKARKLKVLKKFDSTDSQMVDIVDECLAKIETFLT